jgi:hypothetical protein
LAACLDMPLVTRVWMLGNSSSSYSPASMVFFL